MKVSTLLEILMSLSSNGAVNAIISKNTIDNIAQIIFTGNSTMSVTNVIVNIAIHAIKNKIGFILLIFCLFINQDN